MAHNSKNCGRDVAFQEKTKISKIKKCFFSKLSAFFDVIDVLFIKIIIKFNKELTNECRISCLTPNTPMLKSFGAKFNIWNGVLKPDITTTAL